MAKRGTKVKDLAKELGITSRTLIERFRAEGHPIQNSITKLSADLERKAREWFEGPARSDPAASA